MFKNADDEASMKQQLETAEREIDNLGILLDIVTVYLGQEVIPKFKKSKYAVYKQMIKSMSVVEINNAHAIASFWNKIAENETVKKALK